MAPHAPATRPLSPFSHFEHMRHWQKLRLKKANKDERLGSSAILSSSLFSTVRSVRFFLLGGPVVDGEPPHLDELVDSIIYCTVQCGRPNSNKPLPRLVTCCPLPYTHPLEHWTLNLLGTHKDFCGLHIYLHKQEVNLGWGRVIPTQMVLLRN